MKFIIGCLIGAFLCQFPTIILEATKTWSGNDITKGERLWAVIAGLILLLVTVIVCLWILVAR